MKLYFFVNAVLQDESTPNNNVSAAAASSILQQPVVFLSTPAESETARDSSVDKDSRSGRKSSTSAVRAKIARRKKMRHANSIDNPQGSLSDQEATSEANEEDDEEDEEENDSVEEKQNNEPINEKNKKLLEAPDQSYSQLTPETARKNWSSRFSNLKNSFDAASEEETTASGKSRSPSVNRTFSVKPNEPKTTDEDDFIRGRPRERSSTSSNRSKSAHSVSFKGDQVDTRLQTPSKEDKNKLNSLTAGYVSDNQPSGRDSVDYHQYLEMIERFRGNNPKVYSRPLQKFAPQQAQTQSTNSSRREMSMAPPTKYQQPTHHEAPARQVQSQPRDLQSRAETMGLVRTSREMDPAGSNHPSIGGSKKTDMDYQEYMKIINKVRKTKEFTRVRTEQIRLASMYAQEKKRQDELQLEEKRLLHEKETIEREKENDVENITHESGTWPSEAPRTNPSLTEDQEKGEIDNEESEQEKVSTHSQAPIAQQPPHQQDSNAIQTHNLEQQRIRQEQARLEQIRQEQMEQKRQQELRESQVRAEQEKLVKLREEQLRQEKEREEIRRLEIERLQQIQEEQRRLELERCRQEENIRLEQARLEEERRRQDSLQAEKNAIYNRQRLDMEARHYQTSDLGIPYATAQQPRSRNVSSEEARMAEKLALQERLREEHKREQAQIRQEKLNLIKQEETLILRQEEMLNQIEEERLNLTKQEDLIRSRQAGRLEQVRHEKQLLEHQEEMLKMREQQLEQERMRQDQLRQEQRTLREQEEAIKRRQEEISKELIQMSDMSDTGSESITMCQPREGQVFLGKKPSLSLFLPPQEEKKKAEYSEEDEEDTLDEGADEEDYYETKVEVKQKQTSVPTTVRTIETKIDNPPWAPITPYLNYSRSYIERQNQEEVLALLGSQRARGPGVVTSPESVTTSTNLITTPESCTHSLISQVDGVLSVSSSCPSSPPPPLPPPPITTQLPALPPRDDSYAVTAAHSTNSDSQPPPSSLITTTAYHDNLDCINSPQIGGPNSAFKPYASSENLHDDASLFQPKQPELAFNNGLPSKLNHQRQQPLYGKVRELRQQHLKPPFSTTDTEPDMKECHWPPGQAQVGQDMKPKRGKAKAQNYSTSETEEEYQAYMKMRPKWHGKGGHKDSWDPLLIESPPQITQKPVGIIQKPKPQPPVVERGTQINHASIFVPTEGPKTLSKAKSETVADIASTVPQTVVELSNRQTPINTTSGQIKTMQEKYLENVEGPTSSNNFVAYVPPQAENSTTQQRDMHKKLMGEAIKRVGDKKEATKPAPMRMNPAIAAMEIMTRKENKINEMEAKKNKLSSSIISPTQKTSAITSASGFNTSTTKASNTPKPAVITTASQPRVMRKSASEDGNIKRATQSPTQPKPIPLEEKSTPKTFKDIPGALVKPHPSMIAPSDQTQAQPMILLKKQPKILAPEEIKARKNSSEKGEKGKPANFAMKVASSNKSKEQKQSSPEAINREEMFKNDNVKKVAQKFERGRERNNSPSFAGLRARSKSIGSNLSHKMLELEEDKDRIEESLVQSKAILPWTGGSQAVGKMSKHAPPPVLRKRDALMQKQHDQQPGYELRMSKSSDSITAAKLIAEARIQEMSGGKLRINQDMSKSIEQQIDVYTKTREDIRKILQLAKTCSVSDRVRLFNTQKPETPLKSEDERERRAEMIRREIEDAKREKEKGSEESSRSNVAHNAAGNPGSKLRINQPPGSEHKSEIRSILRNNKMSRSEDNETESNRLSLENLPSVKSKIETYLQQAEAPKVEPSNAGAAEAPKSILVKRTASLDRKKIPKLLHSVESNNGAPRLQIYAQSATEDDEETKPSQLQSQSSNPALLSVSSPSAAGLRKSKSFAGQFECDIEASKIDEKQRTMLAFFSSASPPSKSPTPRHSPAVPQREGRRTSLASLSDEILGENADLHDVDAMFESLLNNTFEEESPSSKLGKGAKSNSLRQERLSAKKVVVERPQQQRKGDTSSKEMSVGGKISVDSSLGKNRVLKKQQTWAGGDSEPPDRVQLLHTPSPTQSEYDTCCDPWEDY